MKKKKKTDYRVLHEGKAIEFKTWVECDTYLRSHEGLKVTKGFYSKSDADHWADSVLKTMDFTANRNRKITEAGQSCRKCGTPVIKQIPTTRRKPKQKYYFKSYLRCENCHTMYMLESEKVMID